jgi:hypothetical protein
MKYTNSFYSHVVLISLIAFLPTLCFISCSKDNKDEIVKNDKTYKLGSIMWKLDEGNGQEIIEQELPEEVFSNNGNTTKTIYITPLEKIEETSCFQSENTETLNKWAGRNILVSVPSEFSLLSSEYKYFAGGVKAPLFAGEKVKLQPTTEMTEHSDLQPNIKMTYKATVYLKKITATYTVRFVEDGKGFDSFEVTGKWTGLFFYNIKENITFNDIK